MLNGYGGTGDRCVDGNGGRIGDLAQMGGDVGGSRYLAGSPVGQSMTCGCPWEEMPRKEGVVDGSLWTKNCRVGKPVVVGDMGLSWKRIVIVGDGEWVGVVAGSGSTDLGTAWCKEEMVSSSGVGLNEFVDRLLNHYFLERNSGMKKSRLMINRENKFRQDSTSVAGGRVRIRGLTEWVSSERELLHL